MDWRALGLLDDLEGPRARAARAALLDELHADGVPVEELRRAVAEDRLALLPVERTLADEPRYSAREIVRDSGIDLEFFQTHRRALGLPVADPDERAYGDADVEAARAGAQYRSAGFPDDEALEVTRVLGQGMARYAEATRALVAGTFLQAGTDEREIGHRYADLARDLMPLAAPFMGHVFALHMQQVLRQDAITREQLRTGWAAETQDVTIGFADLVGFTALGESVPVEELGGVAGRLARLTGDVIGPPVRIVKFIGDAVMLATPDPGDMVRATLRLVRAVAEGGLPPLRAGLAHGPAVSRWGDFFGPTVNVASRLTARARPSVVLATEPVHAAAAGAAGVGWAFAGELELRGLSAPVRAWRAEAAP